MAAPPRPHAEANTAAQTWRQGFARGRVDRADRAAWALSHCLLCGGWSPAPRAPGPLRLVHLCTPQSPPATRGATLPSPCCTSQDLDTNSPQSSSPRHVFVPPFPANRKSQSSASSQAAPPLGLLSCSSSHVARLPSPLVAAATYLMITPQSHVPPLLTPTWCPLHTHHLPSASKQC